MCKKKKRMCKYLKWLLLGKLGYIARKKNIIHQITNFPNFSIYTVIYI